MPSIHLRTMRSFRFILLLVPAILLLGGCGVYSFTGATVEGKTIWIHVLENRARNVVPTLSPSLTLKIQNRILSQTGLSPLRTEEADYDIDGYISDYLVTVSGVQNTQQAAQNRLTITLSISFKNRLNPKADFTQAFSRFSDFPATTTIQQVENKLIDEIGIQLADDIFNKAFVNW